MPVSNAITMLVPVPYPTSLRMGRTPASELSTDPESPVGADIVRGSLGGRYTRLRTWPKKAAT